MGGRVCPAEKYRMIHQRLLEANTAAAEDFVEPRPAADEDILLVHTQEYARKLKNGTLSQREEMQMEIPYSPELVKAFWLSAGAAILAAQHGARAGGACHTADGFRPRCPRDRVGLSPGQ